MFAKKMLSGFLTGLSIVSGAGTVPYFTDEAVAGIDLQKIRSDVKNVLAGIEEELPGFEAAAEEDEILKKRLELFRNAMFSLKRNSEATHSPELRCYAAVELEEVKTLREYFHAAIARKNRSRLPVRKFNILDFGAVGDGVTDNYEAFQKAFQATYAAQTEAECFLEIPDGVYYLSRPRLNVPFRTDFLVPPEKGGGQTGNRTVRAYIVIGNQRNLTVSGGENTVILCETPMDPNLLRIGACENVTVKNLKFDYRQRPFTEGVITEIDPATYTLTLQTDDPAAAMPDKTYFKRGHTWSFTPDGKFQWDYGFFMMSGARKIASDKIRYTFERSNPEFNRLKVGMKMVHPSRYSGGGVHLEFCRFVRIENVTLYASAGLSFADTNGYADEFVNCNILRPEGRMISSNGDGFHLASGIIAPTVWGCRGEWMYDDGINSYARIAPVEKRVADGVWQLSDNVPFHNSLVGVVDMDSGQVRAVVRCEKRPGGYAFVPTVNLLTREEIAAGGGGGRKHPDGILCFSRSNLGLLVVDTHFAHHHGKSFVIQSPHALVEGCSSENPQYTGIHIGTMGDWMEFLTPHDVICRNNRIDGGVFSLMTFYRTGDGSNALCHPIRNLVFEGNTLMAPRSGSYENFRNQVLVRWENNRKE